jgi:hypothetical protein
MLVLVVEGQLGVLRPDGIQGVRPENDEDSD